MRNIRNMFGGYNGNLDTEFDKIIRNIKISTPDRAFSLVRSRAYSMFLSLYSSNWTSLIHSLSEGRIEFCGPNEGTKITTYDYVINYVFDFLISDSDFQYNLNRVTNALVEKGMPRTEAERTVISAFESGFIAAVPTRFKFEMLYIRKSGTASSGFGIDLGDILRIVIKF